MDHRNDHQYKVQLLASLTTTLGVRLAPAFSTLKHGLQQDLQLSRPQDEFDPIWMSFQDEVLSLTLAVCKAVVQNEDPDQDFPNRDFSQRKQRGMSSSSLSQTPYDFNANCDEQDPELRAYLDDLSSSGSQGWDTVISPSSAPQSQTQSLPANDLSQTSLSFDNMSSLDQCSQSAMLNFDMDQSVLSNPQPAFFTSDSFNGQADAPPYMLQRSWGAAGLQSDMFMPAYSMDNSNVGNFKVN